jgi:integrase
MNAQPCAFRIIRKMRAFLALAGTTTMRKGEILSLRWDRVHLDFRKRVFDTSGGRRTRAAAAPFAHISADFEPIPSTLASPAPNISSRLRTSRIRF